MIKVKCDEKTFPALLNWWKFDMQSKTKFQTLDYVSEKTIHMGQELEASSGDLLYNRKYSISLHPWFNTHTHTHNKAWLQLKAIWAFPEKKKNFINYFAFVAWPCFAFQKRGDLAHELSILKRGYYAKLTFWRVTSW